MSIVTISIIVGAYLICVYFAYKYFQMIYSKGGQLQEFDPSFWDFFFTVVPLFNAIPAFNYVGEKVRVNVEVNINWNRFFRVDK